MAYPTPEQLTTLVAKITSWEDWLQALCVIAPALSIYERHTAGRIQHQYRREVWATWAASDAQWLTSMSCGPEDINLALDIVQKYWS